MRLRTRIGLMFATGFGVITLGAVLSWFGVNGLLDTTREVRTIHARLEIADAVLGDLVDVETGARGFAIAGQESFLEPFSRAAERLPEHIRQLTELANHDPVELARTATLLDIETRRLAHASEVVRLRRTSGAAAASELIAGGVGNTLMSQARGILSELRANANTRLAELTRQTERRARQAFELIMSSAIGMALVVIICTLVLTRSITRPIAALASAARRISRGERPAIARERDDEIGDLAEALAAMVQAHREAEQRMRVLIDHAPDAFLIADLEGRYIDVNVAATELLGYGHDELVGMTVMDLIPAEDVPRLAAIRKALLVAGTVDVSEWSLLRKDGTRVPVEVSAKILGDGRWQAFVRDISERKRAQAERERMLTTEREHRLRLQTLRQAVLAISPLAASPSGKTTEVLRTILEQARQLTSADFAGLGVADPDKKPLDSWVWSGLTEAEAEAIGASPPPGGLLAGMASCERAPRLVDATEPGAEPPGATPGRGPVGALLTMPIRRNGAAIATLHLAKRSGAPPFTSDDRAIVELLVIHAAVAIENARLYDEVQAAVEAREDLLAAVSHDLRNPLNAILLREDLLGRKRGDDRDLVDHSRWVRRSIGNMYRMIQGLLDAASLDAGHLVLDLEINEFRAVLDEVIDALAPIASEAGVTLECQVPELDVARFDRERLAQVVYNLVGNAIKFTPSGGRAAIRAASSSTELQVTVTDTGRGIAPEVLPHIFERYFTTEHGRRGTGLGLHIAKGIVEAHGGRIWASSVLGQGATFHFTIPTHPTSRAAPGRTTPHLERSPSAV